jgi:hypothetical protein
MPAGWEKYPLISDRRNDHSFFVRAIAVIKTLILTNSWDRRAAAPAEVKQCRRCRTTEQVCQP